MYPLTMDLLTRVGGLVPEGRDYFRAVRDWYKDTQRAFRYTKALVARSSAGAKVDLLLNGSQMAGAAISVHAASRVLNWTLDPRLLKAGRNQISVTTETDSNARLFLRSAGAQEKTLGTHLLDLTAYDPQSTARFGFHEKDQALFDGDAWKIPAGGHLTFKLDLEQPAPVMFSLSLLQEEGNLQGVLQSMLKRVKKCLETLQEERRRTGKNNPGRDEQLASQIFDLEFYIRLHTQQLEQAFKLGDDGSLAEIIARTGNPDVWIDEMQIPVPLKQAPPQPQPQPPPYRQPPPPRQQPRPQPQQQAPPPPRRRPDIPPPRAAQTAMAAGGAAAGGSVISGGLASFIIFASVVCILGGLGYGGWNTFKPISTITFNSPSNGQAVAANIPMQVWLAATDTEGIRSMSVSVRAANGATVKGAVEPASIEFPENPNDTGSRCFTVPVGELNGAEGTLTVTATTVSRSGRKTTEERTVRVGGSVPDLQCEINPTQPKAGQRVYVTIHMINAKPGSVVKFTWSGTDNRSGGNSNTINDQGFAKFEVPGAVKGIEDTITAEVEGTGIRREWKYRFD